MPQTADYTYDREADCFVVTDGAGNELCRTGSPYFVGDNFASLIVDFIKEGSLIFPTAGDTQTANVR